MIHNGDYYSIVNKDHIISFLDDIEQKIICMYHLNFIWKSLILSRYLGQDPDTTTYMEALSGRNIAHVRRSEGQQEDSTEVLSLGCIKLNIDDAES